MTQAAVIGILSVGGAALAIYAWFAERRRKRRHDLDRVGIVPWTLIQVIGMVLAIVGAYYALKLSNANARKHRLTELHQLDTGFELRARVNGIEMIPPDRA